MCYRVASVFIIASAMIFNVGEADLDRLDHDKLDVALKENERNVLLVLYNEEQCDICQVVEWNVRALNDQGGLDYRVKMAALYRNEDNNAAIFQEQHITELPTVVLYIGGKEVKRHEGYLDHASLKDLISSIL